MMKQIVARGRDVGDPEGCVVCHGGNPAASTKNAAHSGGPGGLGPQEFYPDPGSPWVNEHTCGPCHAGLVTAQWNSLMMTEAGKLQGVGWAFGALTGYEHQWGNYDAQNPESPGERLGTKARRIYMEHLKTLEPGAFPEKLTTVPDAPTDLATLADHPEQAAFTYLRAECQRCHLAVKGRNKRGDYRGMGCSACHIPYGNEGLYEGADKTIPRDKPGHLLVHSMQATREARVTVHDVTYSGIPVETCSTCHDRGKRIGVSFQGLMESAYKSPFTAEGEGQLALHTKHYIAMEQDVHYQRGMLCQDCHTSLDVHGDGFLAGTTLAQVEIECTDCHGTPSAYPWELPLGYGDEFEQPPKVGPPRGVATELLAQQKMGSVYPPRDGYLLTARGSPFPEVVRESNHVIVHTAGGKDIKLKPLKLIKTQGGLTTEARVAMDAVSSHMDSMECYSCHASWAPQCYGCHVKIDYSSGKKSFDWVAAGQRHAEPGHAAEAGESDYDTMMAGEVQEQRSYLRWDAPPLGVSGEGRVTPIMPGCQVSATIIGEDGTTILNNYIFRTTAGSEGSGPEGQLTLDMSPVQPHTTGHARPCESCHQSDKAMGYGINGGKLNRPWDEPVVVDLMTADGQILPQSARTQIEPIAGLGMDWSRFVTEDGRQLQTVGHHFSRSRPLNNDERAHMDRRGVCIACHQEIPDESLAVSLLHHVAEYADALPRTNEQHFALTHKILLLSVWVQVGVPLFLALGTVGVGWWFVRRRRAAGVARYGDVGEDAGRDDHPA